MDRILLAPEHKDVLGSTGSGKSRVAKMIAREWPGPGLFIDPEEDTADGGWPGIRLTGQEDVYDILDALSHGEKLYWIPNPEPKAVLTVLAILVKKLLAPRMKWGNLLLAVDECHLYAPQGKPSPLLRVSLQGRKHQVFGMWISPRPQNLHRNLITQSQCHVLFRLDWEDAYYRAYGLPADAIKQGTAEEFSYVVLRRGKVMGPFREA